MRKDWGVRVISGAAMGFLLAAEASLSLPASTKIQITGVQLQPTAQGLELILETSGGNRPPVLLFERGKEMVADLTDAQLALPQGNRFFQPAPFLGIESVAIESPEDNLVRIVVTGEVAAPSAQESPNRDPRGIILSYQPTSLAPQQVLVPEPQVTIDGIPTDVLVPEGVNNTVIQPRASAPPVGDIAVASNRFPSPNLDLGTNERVPFLVLRNAQVLDVLALLAKAADLNFFFTGEGETEQVNLTVTLDVEDQPLEQVFNNLLRISGLQASRSGDTVFVAPQLPNDARQQLVRSLRLNQVSVDAALDFLAGLGAEISTSQEQQVTTVRAIGVEDAAGGTVNPTNQVQTTTRRSVETRRVEYKDTTPPLRRLMVVGDQRSNSVTLIGAPEKVDLAISQLVQLDVRRRQVSINVKVLDINLNAVDRLTTSFSFGIDDTRVIQNNGVGLINFGTPSPAQTTPPLDPVNTFGNVIQGVVPVESFNFARNFLAQLQAVVSNGNGKILTDPTLVVQEGQSAVVQLTDDVITNFEVTSTGAGEDLTQTIQLERTPAGLILQIQVDRIDDNGFVSLSVAPSISAPVGTTTFGVQGSEIQVTLLTERRVSSGQIRVRDGQTLVLSGIIRDSEQTTVNKVPLLGDLPLLGALFRNTQRSNERDEVIVLLTPKIVNDITGDGE